MVGSIHPFGQYVDNIPHYSVEDLVWIVWDRYRGGKWWGDSPLKDHCCVCNDITEWAVDQLWKKWEHGSFLPFAVFVNNLINSDIYDYYMGKVSTEKMSSLRLFCIGIVPDPKTFIYKH